MLRIKNHEFVKNKLKEYLRDYLELKGVRIKGRHFKCFNHNDENASAGLTEDGKGFRCFACNARGDIFTAYSILEEKSIEGKYFFHALKELADLFNVQYEIEKQDTLTKEAEYVYTDTAGEEIYKIVRFHKVDKNGNVIYKSNGKSKKIFSAFTKVDGKWIKDMHSKKRYLYNLVDVVTAIKNNKEIYMVEGEKCVDLLKNEFGVTATTIPFGSNSWKEPYINDFRNQLKGAKVVLIPDNDSQGYMMMKKVIYDIKNVTKSLKLIKLTDDIKLPKGGDIEEWIELGGTKERLLELKKNSVELAGEKRIWYQIDDKGKVKINTGLLARHLIENYPSLYCGGRFYLYSNGVYKECKYNEAQGIIKSKIDDKYLKMSLIRDVEGLWSIDNEVKKDPNELDPDPNIINLKNGLYNVIANEFKEHDTNYLSTIQFDVEYNPKAKGDVFRKFLDDMVPEKETQDLLQEIAGYAMSTFNKAKKFFIIQGPRDSGKTTFLNLIASIIGEEHLSHVNIQNLSDRFNKAELFGKVANIATELPDKGIDDVGFLKALVGQDSIIAERKGKDPFTFVNKAKLIFACNSIPINYGDKSDAFYNKMIIVQFNRQLADDEIDIMLPEKLEKEYVFLWAMEGLRRLIKNNFRFTETVYSKKVLEEYKIKSNYILEFIHDCCVLKQDAEVVSTELYDRYKKYCKENNYKPLGRNKFKSELENSLGSKIKAKLVTNNRLSGYSGITLK